MSAWPVDRRGALLLVVAAVVAWLILPTAPNYDTATHLVWAGELLAGRSADVGAAASPTLHPLWLVVAIPATLTGAGAPLLQLLTLVSFAVVIACAFRLAADVAGLIAGAVAALAAASSFALMLLAFKAYVDLPFLALVLTALVVEWRSSRGGSGESAPHPLVVPTLMLVAGLLRPEAWAFGLLFLVLRAWRSGAGAQVPGDSPAALAAGAARAQLVPALVVLAAPVLWFLTDLLLTGDPFHSLHGTQALAEELGRPTGLVSAPKELVVLLADLARPPIALAGLIGLGLALRLRGWPSLVHPVAVLAASAAGFLLVGALGLPLLQRYLLVPAVLVCVFAGVAAAVVLAWARGLADPAPGAPTAAEAGEPGGVPSALRLGAAAALVVGAVGVGGYLVLKADSFRIVGEGVLREARWQREGAELLTDPAVIRAGACGPITLPTYRFIPELTLRADLADGRVLSRATALGGAGPQPRGVAIVIDGPRSAKKRLGWAAGVPRTTNDVPPGFREVARRGPFVATANCG